MAAVGPHAAQFEPPEHGRIWQFLNITEPSQSRNEDFQEHVRKQAMREHRRYERVKRTEAFAKAKRKDGGTGMSQSSGRDSLAIPTKNNALEQMGLGVCKAKTHLSRTILQPQALLGAGFVDPFNTCPTDGQQGYYYLINHCK